MYGMIPYMDPNIFDTQKPEAHPYNLTEKSDIYSFGVLLWELTSCSSPFNFENLDDIKKELIALEILEGRREIPVPGTNRKFVELYQSKYEIKVRFIFIIIMANPNLLSINRMLATRTR